MIPSQLCADIPDLTDTELRIILVVMNHNGIMTMDDVQQRTGRTRQVYDAVKTLEAKGWLERQKVASIGPIAWRWRITRYDVAPPVTEAPAPPPAPVPEVVPATVPDTAQAAPVKAKAPSKKPPKPVTAQDHPAVVAYMEIVRRRPTHASAELIAQSVSDVDKWRESVKQYITRGWNPMNVSGMIQVYTGAITLTYKKGRYSTEIVHQPPDVARAAFDEYLRENENGEDDA